MGIFLRSKVGLVDIPAELFFVAFSLKFEVKMDGYEYFFSIGGSFLFNVEDIWS